MKSTINLQRTETGWTATWTGPKAREIEYAFGTTTIPTAFTAQANASKVLEEISRLNPECKVVVVINKLTYACGCSYPSGEGDKYYDYLCATCYREGWTRKGSTNG